jgi:VanZ family protein
MRIRLSTTPALRALCFFAFAFTTLFVLFHDPPDASGAYWDKAIHFVVYGGMAFMLWLAFGKRWALAAFVLVWMVGLGDEVMQHFTPGRTADVMDLVADALGAGICLVVARKLFT